jgi:uncharacterized protein YyaL (SSP411 family)
MTFRGVCATVVSVGRSPETTRVFRGIPARLAAAAFVAAAAGALVIAQAPPTYTNRLVHEKSPYLQLHAHNPVDWYPWGPEAFERARREGKPIFLSIGYSTCHWCHVMEAETFSDPALAELLNRSVVSIKVDREERPDLDRVYQSYVLWSYGGGGWPLNVFLTPDLKPFSGSVYLPPDDRDGRQGFRSWLLQIGAAWASDRGRLIEAANKGKQMIELQIGGAARPASDAIARALDQTYRDISNSFDESAGGFGPAPKFPRPVILNFLLRHHARTRTKRALDMAVQTLGAMATGGIHDHLGGGFHRYATDRQWLVPHFEKMLYDQAQLAIAYTEAYQATRNVALAAVARDILDYVLRDMRAPEGGFYSAEDADSPPQAGVPGAAEGAFYVWTVDQIRDAAGPAAADLVAFHYGLVPAGNVPAGQDAQGALSGRNVLNVRRTVAETAAKFRKSESETRAMLLEARQRLAAARSTRPRPPRDDKVLVAWNGMMLSAFARAAQVLDEPEYLDAAGRAAEFIESRMYDPRSRTLERRYRDGDASIDAMLEDYVFLIQGLLDLFEASFDVKWLAWAIELQEVQDKRFWDAGGGAYFSTTAEAPDVIVRVKEDYDGAEPSPNSVAAMNLLRLWQMTDRREWRDRTNAIFRAQASQLTRAGANLPQLAVALDFSLSKPKQIVIAGAPGASDTRAMLKLVHDRFIPNKILLLADGGEGQARLARWLPFLKTMDRRDGKATAYICEDYACKLPTADLRTAARLLDGK